MFNRISPQKQRWKKAFHTNRCYENYQQQQDPENGKRKLLQKEKDTTWKQIQEKKEAPQKLSMGKPKRRFSFFNESWRWKPISKCLEVYKRSIREACDISAQSRRDREAGQLYHTLGTTAHGRADCSPKENHEKLEISPKIKEQGWNGVTNAPTAPLKAGKGMNNR